jgi:hypothetical protein
MILVAEGLPTYASCVLELELVWIGRYFGQILYAAERADAMEPAIPIFGTIGFGSRVGNLTYHEVVNPVIKLNRVNRRPKNTDRY